MDSNITLQTKQMIDSLKAVCTNFGLGNASSEYKIITEVFLYKFLNDKFLFEAKRVEPALAKLSPADAEKQLAQMTDDDYELFLLGFGPDTAKLKQTHFISYLFNRKNEENFHTVFDDTLLDIATYNIDIFSVRTGGQSKMRLFSGISQHVIEAEKKDDFCRAIIDKIAECSFDSVFEQKYDFFAQIFEYLIKDYNKDFGKYAEYYTPHSIASIIAKIMVPNGVKNVTVYDPAAGSGTLVLALAHEIGESNCTIYTQDISQKSNEFLRLNLILNNLVHSLPNVVHDDTLLRPYHKNAKGDGLATFDYIVSNPPFNMDFSDSRDTLAGDNYKKRFWAGVPNIPNKDKDKMAIYLMFLQHIIYSLGPKGKAAVVVPTGFLTAGSGIQKKIREHLVKERMLRGVISMPSNIFATTGTNVSILFIDRENKDGNVILMDASKLGTKEKVDGKNQRTVLSVDEITHIIISRKINNNRNICFNLESIAKTLYDYWFTQFDFPNAEGKPYRSSGGEMVWNDQLKRKIPKGWDTATINEMTKSCRGVSYDKNDLLPSPENGVLVLRGNNIQNNRLVYDNNVAYVPHSLVAKEQQISAHDIILTMSSGSKDHIGKCTMFQYDSPHTYGAFLTKFTPDKDKVGFVYLSMISDFFKKKVKAICNGTGINNLTNETFDNLIFPKPTEAVLARFEETISPMFEKMGVCERENEELTKLRDWLLPMLMNGQATVE